MKKLLLLLLPFFIYSGICNAQAPNWIWGEAGSLSSQSFGYCSGLAFGPLDTIYIAGRTGSSLTLGGLTLNVGGTFPYIGKLDTNFLAAPNTNGIWLAAGLGTGFDYGYDICSDNLGYLYNTGDENSGSSAYVVKFSHGGAPIHVSNTGVNNGQGYGVVADNLGDIYVTGNYSGSGVQFGTNPTLPYAGGSWAGFLTKYDSTLNPIWSTYFSAANDYVTGKGVATDLQGNIYVVGSYTGPCTFYSAYGNPTTVTATNYTTSGADGNLFVVKYDSAGVVQWVVTAANAGLYNNDWGGRNRIVVDSCGNLYVGGIFDGPSQFGTLPAINTNGGDDMFLAKYNTRSMAWEWVQTGGGTGADGVNQIALDKTSNVYVVGYMGVPATFNDTTLSSGNFFLAKYSNSNGDLDWIQSANIQGQSATMDGVAIDGQNYCYVVGTYSGGSSTLGNFALPNVNGGSVFIAKMDTVPPREIVPIVDSIYCTGTGFIIFNTIGTFNSGNVFTAQLSDSSGSFATYQNIGYDTSTTGGTINITIPPGTPAGTTYLIRVVSSNPPTSSYVNGCGSYYSQGVYLDDYFITIGNGSIITPVITPSDTSICPGTSLTLTASGGVSYTWSNGDTGSVITVNPVTDTILTLIATGGCAPTSASDTININQVPPLVINPQNPASICPGQSISLIAPASGSNYNWSPSSGLNATTGNSVSANPTVTTTYTVTGNDSLGCSVTDTGIVVTVQSALPLNVLPQDTAFCSGQSATLYVSGGGTGFIWSPVGSLTDSSKSGDSVVASPITTTTYSVTGIDSSGCAAFGSTMVTVIPSPGTPTFTQNGDTLISSSVHDNQWYRNDSLLVNDTSQDLIITITGEYFVSVTNEANGCSTESDSMLTAGIAQVAGISNQLSIFPNPFNSNIFIQISSSATDIKDWTMQVTDVLGRTVYSQQTLNYSNEINLSNLSTGMYFITVISKTARAVFPVVRQN